MNTSGAASANRLSYVLGLTGPSLALDTACSSSLVALHAACQALRAGDCSTALVAAADLIISPHCIQVLLCTDLYCAVLISTAHCCSLLRGITPFCYCTALHCYSL